MSDPELTRLLQCWKAGDRSVEPELVAAVYPVLRALAHRQLYQHDGMTLQPTELAHEAYVKLIGQREVDWQNRGHFFAIAAHVVRRVVIDYLRERGAQKRGGGETRVSIDYLGEDDMPASADEIDWLRLDVVLSELETFDVDSARVVEMRYFVGLSLPETALACGVSASTVARQWRTARAWLRERLAGHL